MDWGEVMHATVPPPPGDGLQAVAAWQQWGGALQ